jgi:hypothetical protein
MNTRTEKLLDIGQSTFVAIFCGVLAAGFTTALLGESDQIPKALHNPARLAAFVIVSVIAGRLHWKYQSRQLDLAVHRRCGQCGYDLSHSDCRCPECGTFVPLPLEKGGRV